MGWSFSQIFTIHSKTYRPQNKTKSHNKKNTIAKKVAHKKQPHKSCTWQTNPELQKYKMMATTVSLTNACKKLLITYYNASTSEKGGGWQSLGLGKASHICIECPVFVQPIKNPCDYAPCMSNYLALPCVWGGGSRIPWCPIYKEFVKSFRVALSYCDRLRLWIAILDFKYESLRTESKKAESKVHYITEIFSLSFIFFSWIKKIPLFRIQYCSL